jgi:hypothetical protein
MRAFSVETQPRTINSVGVDNFVLYGGFQK